MDPLTFIVEIVKALAWPSVAIVVICVFRDKLSKLLEALEEWKGLGMEARFNRKLEVAAAEARELEAEERTPDPAQPTVNHAPEQRLDDPLQETPIANALLLSANPVAGFALARDHLHRTLVAAFQQATGTVPGMILSIHDVIARLEKERYLTARMRRTIIQLLDLGSAAVHAKVLPTYQSARDYVDAVQTLCELIKQRSIQLPKAPPV